VCRPAPARINSLARLWWWRWPSIARGGADDDCPPPWTDCLLCYGTVFSTEKRHTDISTRNNHGVVHVCCSNSFLHSVYHGVRAAAIGLNFSLSLSFAHFIFGTDTDYGSGIRIRVARKGQKDHWHSTCFSKQQLRWMRRSGTDFGDAAA
jgi:hypothetical protein